MPSRMDTWVLWVSIAIPLVFGAVLILWHLVIPRLGKLLPRRRPAKQTTEPLPWGRFTKPPASEAGKTLPSTADAESAQLAREMLALIEQDLGNCLLRCETLAAAWPGLPADEETKQLASRLKTDLQRLQRTCADLVNAITERRLS